MLAITGWVWHGSGCRAPLLKPVWKPVLNCQNLATWFPYIAIWWINSKVPEGSMITSETVVQHVRVHTWLYKNHALLHSHDTTIRIHAEAKSTIMTNEHASLEKYTSHFIRKGCEKVMCERWIGDWTKTATYRPPVPPSLEALLSRSAGQLNRGPEGPAVCWVSVLTASKYNNRLQTNWTSCRTGLYHCLRPTAFCGRHIGTQFNPSTVKVIPWYLRPDALVPWLTAESEVNMLQLELYRSLCLHKRGSWQFWSSYLCNQWLMTADVLERSRNLRPPQFNDGVSP